MKYKSKCVKRVQKKLPAWRFWHHMMIFLLIAEISMHLAACKMAYHWRSAKIIGCGFSMRCSIVMSGDEKRLSGLAGQKTPVGWVTMAVKCCWSFNAQQQLNSGARWGGRQTPLLKPAQKHWRLRMANMLSGPTKLEAFGFYRLFLYRKNRKN